MSNIVYPLNHYIKSLSLKKGQKIYYYNQNHSRYEEWYHMGVTQPLAGKTAFYDGNGKQLYFTCDMLNLCGNTIEECKLAYYKQRENYINSKIKLHEKQIKRLQADIKLQLSKQEKYKKELQKERKKVKDIIDMFPEEFV